MPKASSHPEFSRLAGFLRSISLRSQLLAALQFLLLLSSVVLIILLGSPAVLEIKESVPYLLPLYSAVAMASFGILFLIGLWRILNRPSPGQAARRLEEKFPKLKDDVTNSLLLFDQLANGELSNPVSKGLITAHLRRTADAVSSIHLRQVVSLKKALGHLRILSPLVVAFSIFFAMDPAFVARSLAMILHPLSNRPVQKTVLSVEPGESVILRGSPFVVRARVEGRIPGELFLSIWPEAGEMRRTAMESEGNSQFVYRMESVQSSFRFQAIHGGAPSPIYGVRVVDPPDIRKIKLTLTPPDYTGLPEEVREEGHVDALKGTAVKLEILATRGVVEGRLILNQESELPLKVQGERLSGSLFIFFPGSYSIRLKSDDGFENPAPVHYQVRLLADRFPEAEILGPAEDMEVTGNEMIPVLYSARDDFGITALRLGYQAGGIERFIHLKGAQGVRFLGPDLFNWDLSSLSLTAGDRVLYRIEASDNDAISGPKWGYSRTFSLSVRDEKTRASKEGEEMEQIAGRLLDLLADQLEEVGDPESLMKGMDELLEQVDRNLDQRRERAERFDLEALKGNLKSLRERIPGEPKERVIQEMERLALHAEEMARRAKMKELEALAREIRNRQSRLLDSLHDLKERFTKEGLEAAMRELKKIEELLRSVMEALNKFASGLPDEFMNTREMEGLHVQDMFKDLEELQKKLASGDIAGALEAAQRLLQALSDMMAAMGRAGAQSGMSAMDRIQGEMSRQAGELDRILAEQRAILNETEKIDQEARRRLEEEVDKRLAQSLPRLKEILQKLETSLPQEQADSVKEMEKLLGTGRLERFSHLVKELEKEVSDNEEAREWIREFKELGEALNPDPGEMMADDTKRKFPGLSSRQEALGGRTKEFKEKLDMLAQLFPGLSSEILGDIQRAEESMREASKELREEDAQGAIPPEQEVIRRLSKSHQSMQQMAQQMAMRMQAMRWGYPPVYDPRAGWYYGPWAPQPTLPQPEFRRPRERGFTGIDREEFDPPSKDVYRAPEIFREKVMESLKEEVPPPYRREVEKYFRGLAE